MIGLTGGIASGKSTVTARLKSLGAFVADADEISREVMASSEVLRRIREEFGSGVFREDGTLARDRLAQKVFSSKERVAALDRITHPLIAKRLIEVAEEAQHTGLYPLVFVDAALLIESGFYRICNRVWLVTANTGLRIRRIILRDGLSYEAAAKRIASQTTDEEKLPYASVVIENNGSLEELIEKTDAAFRSELLLRNLSRYENSPDNDTYIKELMGNYGEDE